MLLLVSKLFSSVSRKISVGIAISSLVPLLNSIQYLVQNMKASDNN